MSKEKKVNQPHDKIVKKLLSNAIAAKDILSLYLPENVKALIDLDHLVLQRDSFIDDEHRAFAVDILYKTTFAKEEGYLWVLVEHQRKDDPWLPLRIFVYMGIIWDHIRRTAKSVKLPLVYPLVIYNGDKPYASSLTFADLIQPESSKKLFHEFFSKPFNIVDLAKIKDDELRKETQDHVKGVALLMTLKHVFDKEVQYFFESILVEIYKKLDQSGSRDDLADLVYYLLNEADFKDKNKFWSIIHQEFSSELEGKVMTIAQELEAKGEARGIEKGKLEIAKTLLNDGQDIDYIVKITKLSKEKIIELQKKSRH